MFRFIYNEAPVIALLVAWAWCLLKADEITLNVLIPFAIGSFDWINWFFR